MSVFCILNLAGMHWITELLRITTLRKFHVDGLSGLINEVRSLRLFMLKLSGFEIKLAGDLEDFCVVGFG